MLFIFSQAELVSILNTNNRFHCFIFPGYDKTKGNIVISGVYVYIYAYVPPQYRK